LALGPHFTYRNGRHKAAPALEEYTTVRHGNLAMLCSKAHINFSLLNKFLAADRGRFRPAIVSLRYVSTQSCFDPFTLRLLKHPHTATKVTISLARKFRRKSLKRDPSMISRLHKEHEEEP
jgi:hypothetical protein